jgi:hypothetical protein
VLLLRHAGTALADDLVLLPAVLVLHLLGPPVPGRVVQRSSKVARRPRRRGQLLAMLTCQEAPCLRAPAAITSAATRHSTTPLLARAGRWCGRVSSSGSTARACSSLFKSLGPLSCSNVTQVLTSSCRVPEGHSRLGLGSSRPGLLGGRQICYPRSHAARLQCCSARALRGKWLTRTHWRVCLHDAVADGTICASAAGGGPRRVELSRPCCAPTPCSLPSPAARRNSPATCGGPGHGEPQATSPPRRRELCGTGRGAPLGAGADALPMLEGPWPLSCCVVRRTCGPLSWSLARALHALALCGMLASR